MECSSTPTSPIDNNKSTDNNTSIKVFFGYTCYESKELVLRVDNLELYKIDYKCTTHSFPACFDCCAEGTQHVVLSHCSQNDTAL